MKHTQDMIDLVRALESGLTLSTLDIEHRFDVSRRTAQRYMDEVSEYVRVERISGGATSEGREPDVIRMVRP